MTHSDDVPMDEGNDFPAGRSTTNEELRSLISQVETAALNEGDTWFILNQKWWNDFRRVAAQGFCEDMNPIDNTVISEQHKGSFYLKQHLGETVDYVPIPSAVFKRLEEIYGVADDRRDYICRDVVKKNGQLMVEVYPRIIHLSLARNRELKVDLLLKPDDTMESLSARAIQDLGLEPDDHFKFYVMNGENPELIDTTQSVDSYFDTVQKVVVDVEQDGEWFYKSKTAVQPQSKSLFGQGNSSIQDVASSSSQSSSSAAAYSEEEEEGAEIQIRLPEYSRSRFLRLKIVSTLSTATSTCLWPFWALWLQMHGAWWHFSQLWPEEVRNAVAFFVGWWILRPPSYLSSRITGNGASSSSSSSYSSSTYNSSGMSGSVSSSKQHPGQCGLSNLGNTCFMASALQCLSNMPPLRDYFISGQYTDDLNEENPLGTQGNLALAVGELFKHMWTGHYTSLNPRKFKSTIGTFAPRFNGYSQQDAHELMAYVLDGLHEDLNRIKQKPYVEDNDEFAKLPEAEYAEKSWEMYKMRNDSIIVDTLHGQLKSTLICPVCQKISIKFDPFGYLSLPLPPKEQIVKQTVIVMFLNRKWAKFSLGITETTTVTEAQRLMLDKLQPEETHFFVFFYLPNQYNDEATLLRPDDRVRQQGKEVYVAEVQHDTTIRGSKILIAYNRIKICRSVSLPMVYSLPPNTPLTREFLTGHVFETTKRFFTKGGHVELNGGGSEDGDVQMTDSDQEREREELYKLYVVPPGATSSLIQVPANNEPIAFPDDGSTDIYRNFVAVTFQWNGNTQKMFNQYKGSDLIEREMAVSTRRKVELCETLDWFTTKEQLGEQDSWYCPQCKKHERATKQLDLWKLPEILILHLKRFQYTKWSREKLTWEVVIPVRGLDLTDKVVNPNHEKAIYDLIAVSRHYGSLSGGHYTATGYNDKLKKWIEFNDSNACQMLTPGDPMESSDPYILVYRRRKLDARGEPIDTFMADPHEVNDYPTRAKRSASSRHQVDENMEMEED